MGKDAAHARMMTLVTWGPCKPFGRHWHEERPGCPRIDFFFSFFVRYITPLPLEHTNAKPPFYSLSVQADVTDKSDTFIYPPSGYLNSEWVDILLSSSPSRAAEECSHYHLPRTESSSRMKLDQFPTGLRGLIANEATRHSFCHFKHPSWSTGLAGSGWASGLPPKTTQVWPVVRRLDITSSNYEIMVRQPLASCWPCSVHLAVSQGGVELSKARLACSRSI